MRTDQGCSPVLSKSRTLRRIGERGPRAGLLEGLLVVLIVLVVGHAEWRGLSTTTEGLLSAIKLPLMLVVIVDKDEKDRMRSQNLGVVARTKSQTLSLY